MAGVLFTLLLIGLLTALPTARLTIAGRRGRSLRGMGQGMNIPALYSQLIIAIGLRSGMDDSLLHLHAGMAILLATRIITRRSLASPVPLLVVLAAEIGNEVLDRLHFGSWRWTDTIGDFIDTLLWPTLLFIGLRLRPVAQAARRKRR